jgi:hypothetical protein
VKFIFTLVLVVINVVIKPFMTDFTKFPELSKGLGIMADKIITAFKFANLFTVVIRTLYA